MLASTTMAPAFRADRAEELKPAAWPRSYCWFSVALVAGACVCLILAATLGEPWLLAVAAGIALLAAAVASCG